MIDSVGILIQFGRPKQITALVHPLSVLVTVSLSYYKLNQPLRIHSTGFLYASRTNKNCNNVIRMCSWCVSTVQPTSPVVMYQSTLLLYVPS